MNVSVNSYGWNVDSVCGDALQTKEPVREVRAAVRTRLFDEEQSDTLWIVRSDDAPLDVESPWVVSVWEEEYNEALQKEGVFKLKLAGVLAVRREKETFGNRKFKVLRCVKKAERCDKLLTEAVGTARAYVPAAVYVAEGYDAERVASAEDFSVRTRPDGSKVPICALYEKPAPSAMTILHREVVKLLSKK